MASNLEQHPAWDAFQQWYKQKFGDEVGTKGPITGMQPDGSGGSAAMTGQMVDAGYQPRNPNNPSTMDTLLMGGWNPSTQDINSHFSKLVEQEKQRLAQEQPDLPPEQIHEMALKRITQMQGDEASGRSGIREGLAFQRMQSQMGPPNQTDAILAEYANTPDLMLGAGPMHREGDSLIPDAPITGANADRTNHSLYGSTSLPSDTLTTTEARMAAYKPPASMMDKYPKKSSRLPTPGKPIMKQVLTEKEKNMGRAGSYQMPKQSVAIKSASISSYVDPTTGRGTSIGPIPGPIMQPRPAPTMQSTPQRRQPVSISPEQYRINKEPWDGTLAGLYRKFTSGR